MSKQQKPITRVKPSSPKSNFPKNFTGIWQAALLFAVAFILYARTLSFEYVLDDRMVMTENSVVQQGFAGIPTLLTKDSFYGYDQARGRTDQRKTYRPLSFITFAVEKQLFGNKPRVSHAINVLLYAWTVVLVFWLLKELLPVGEEGRTSAKSAGVKTFVPMLAALLFAAHPIHTEVVANVKSRDEILALMCAAWSLWLLFRYRSGGGAVALYGASLLLFALALLAKESMLPFVVVVPLALYFFGKEKNQATNPMPFGEIIRLSSPYLALAAIFAVIWFGFVGRVEEKVYETILGNSFADASLSDKYATVTDIFSLYVAKAVFPTTLSIGYSYNQIPLHSWADWQTLCGVVLILSGLAAVVYFAPKRHLAGFCVLFFALMLAVTSNFFIYSGGLLGERFLFTPSLAMVLLLAWLLGFGEDVLKRRGTAIPLLVAGGGLIFFAYAAQTLVRTGDWQNDLTLLRADVVSTSESFNMHQGYAKELIRRAPQEINPLLRRSNLDTALSHLRTALRIYPPGEAETFAALGNYFDLMQNYDSAAHYAETALRLAPVSQVYRKNLSVIHSNKGVDFAEAKQFPEAVVCFRRAFMLDSGNAVLCANIGGAFAAMRERDSAVAYLQRALRLNPMLPSARANLQRLMQER